MFRFIRVLAVVAAAGLLSLPLSAQSKMELKLATFAPANTTWHRALTEMGAAVNKATSGRVVIRVFANGTQGFGECIQWCLPTDGARAAQISGRSAKPVTPLVGTLGFVPWLDRTCNSRIDYSTGRPAADLECCPHPWRQA